MIVDDLGSVLFVMCLDFWPDGVEVSADEVGDLTPVIRQLLQHGIELGPIHRLLFLGSR